MCPNCQNTTESHPDRKCAFHEDGKFNPDNWRCETLRKLLDTRRCETVYGSDFSVDVITHPEDGEAIVLTRYKRRGKTSQATVVSDDAIPAKELTLEKALEYVAAFGG